MAKVYIAGPMRGHPDLNFPAFDKAAALGRSLGWTVISPAEMDREHGDTAESVGPTVVNGGHPDFVRKFIRRDYRAIIEGMRAEDGDAMAMLPGWIDSVGAIGEWGLARWAKLRFLDALTFKDIQIIPSFHVTGQYQEAWPTARRYSNYTPGAFEGCYNPRPASDFADKCDPELGCGLDDHALLIIQAAKQAADQE